MSFDVHTTFGVYIHLLAIIDCSQLSIMVSNAVVNSGKSVAHLHLFGT